MKDINCPFCGSKNLIVCDWHLDAGDTKAMECNNCYAGAPLSAWERLAQKNNPQPITIEEWNA